MKSSWIFSSVILFLMVISCTIQDDLEGNILPPKDHSYTVALPLVNSSLTIADILSISGQEENELLSEALDGSMTLVYTQEVEIPAFAGLDQIEVPDVTVPAISIDVGELPTIDNISIDAGSISLREIIGDDETADLIDQLGVVGDTISDTITQATSEVDLTVNVCYGIVCIDTTIQMDIGGGVMVDQDTVICADSLPCYDQNNPCSDTTYCRDTLMPLDTVIARDLVPDSLAGLINGDSIGIPVDTVIPPLESQTVGPMDPVVEAIELSGFSRITLSQGTMTLTIQNHFPFDLENVDFELRTGTTLNNVWLGNFRFNTITAGQTQSSVINLAGKYFLDDVSVQLLSLSTAEYSGAIDSDSSMSLSLETANLQIDNAAGHKDDLAVEGIISGDTLIDSSITQSIDLGADLTVSTVVLDSGVFSYSISSSLPTDIDILLSIPDLVDSTGEIFQTVIGLDYMNLTPVTQAEDIDLSNYSLTIMQPGDTAGRIAVNYAAVIGEDTMRIGNTAAFSFGASISGIKVKEARGDFGQLAIDVIDSSITFDIYNQQFSGRIIFSEPSLKVIFSNSFGLPVGINFDMVGYNTQTGDSVEIGDFSADNLIIDAPIISGETVSDTFTIDETNGLSDLFALPPNGIDLSLGVITNPDSTIEATNFITDSSSISAKVDVEIPFTGRIEEFVLTDTLEFSIDSTIDVEKSSLTLVSEISNGFPLGVGMQIVFLDENGTELARLFDLDAEADTLFSPGIINSEGRVVAESISNRSIVLTGSKASILDQTTHLAITGKLRSSDADQGRNFKLYSDYGFGIKLGLIATVNSDDLLPFIDL